VIEELDCSRNTNCGETRFPLFVLMVAFMRKFKKMLKMILMKMTVARMKTIKALIQQNHRLVVTSA